MSLDLQRVRDNGVVGAGGAGFPTYRKLDARAEIAILNAAECEPLLHKDKEILKAAPEGVLRGFDAARRHVGATRAIVAIKHKYVDLIETLRTAGAPLGLEVFELGDYYPAGDEFVTVFETTKRIVPPGGIPLDVGCIVMNVETALNLASDRPVTRKYLTVCGDVPDPATVHAPLGMSFADVLAAVGADPANIGHVLVGGVMKG